MRIIDSHVHLDFHQPEKLLALTEHYRYERFAVMAIPCEGDPLNTLECLRMKLLAPERAYVYGGMIYPPHMLHDGRSHVRQLEFMMDVGCDGWKLLESKPSVYRQLQIPLDGPVFEDAFAMAEREHIPVTWHAGDPATFWDADKAPRFAVENHWLCIGEGYPSLQEIYRQVENVLERHPRLRVSMAHLYFTSDDRPHAERLLERYEDFRLDLTPGVEMYQSFVTDPEGWSGFFEKYQDRLIFGTDLSDTEHEVVFSDQDKLFDRIHRVLSSGDAVEIAGVSGRGLGLSQEIQEKLYRKNFLDRIAGAPRPLNSSGLRAYGRWLLERLPEEEQARAHGLLEMLCAK